MQNRLNQLDQLNRSTSQQPTNKPTNQSGEFQLLLLLAWKSLAAWCLDDHLTPRELQNTA
jgi:hypothetical protein